MVEVGVENYPSVSHAARINEIPNDSCGEEGEEVVASFSNAQSNAYHHKSFSQR